jgi:hypothetical protein
VASLGRDFPCLRIVSVDRLSNLSGIASSELTGHDLTYQDDGVTVVPWQVALRVATALARRHSDRVLLQVKEEERDLRRLLADGSSRSQRESEEREQDIRLSDEQGERQSRDLHREWVGEDALQMLDEVAALRAEIRRVTAAALAAVAALERAGCRAEAENLWESLDTGSTAAG